MSTPPEFERAPAAWSAAQAAAVREAAAELRAARRLAQNPSIRRVQRFADRLVGYGVLVACVLLFGPILTCGGFALPVGTCVGTTATNSGLGTPTASSQRPKVSGLDGTDEVESGSESWYSYRRRDGVTVYAFGVPPLGSSGLKPGDHPVGASGPDGPSQYAGASVPSRPRGAARYSTR
jgi:hypothetical protein